MASGQHQPLNRQSERFVREGVDITLSTLADLIGHACVALAPIHALIEHHVLAGSRVHGDDTTSRCWREGAPKQRVYGLIPTALAWDSLGIPLNSLL